MKFGDEVETYYNKSRRGWGEEKEIQPKGGKPDVQDNVQMPRKL